MKLIIQIPWQGRAAQLPATLADLPRQLPGFEHRRMADHRRRIGPTRPSRSLVRTGSTTSFACRTTRASQPPSRPARHCAEARRGRDRQHRRRQPVLRPDISKLVEPIVAGRADMVIGDREVDSIAGLLAPQEAPATARARGRPARLRHDRARHDLRGSAPTTARRRCRSWSSRASPTRWKG